MSKLKFVLTLLMPLFIIIYIKINTVARPPLICSSEHDFTFLDNRLMCHHFSSCLLSHCRFLSLSSTSFQLFFVTQRYTHTHAHTHAHTLLSCSLALPHYWIAFLKPFVDPCVGTCQVKLFQSSFSGITPQIIFSGSLQKCRKGQYRRE